ncbi:hypothetical protein BCR43DRAFT_489075 [Syncephalastrum racemosum]|uniref:C2H2-type domain-containing protein n=1 Tax=Syncephalastrum racemosum TaxID=13706 RepID=A0A1X2HJP3_SYNRA|nr:hypothetical protein BCR43DRAFT_489075 [Syncephalastrum racemosum]
MSGQALGPGQTSGPDVHACIPCQKSFETANALYAHRSKDHCNELLFDLGHDIVIRVTKADGKFQCPLVECKKEYANVESFRKHSVSKHPNSSVTVGKSDIPRPIKRRRLTTAAFTQKKGCEATLRLGNEVRSTHLATGMGCVPVAFHLTHESISDPVSMQTLVNSSELHSACLKLPFASPSVTSQVGCVVQLHDDEYTITPAPREASALSVSLDEALVKLKQTVSQSWLPRLLDNSDYDEVPNDLLAALNYDIRRRPGLLQAIAKLHAGAIIVDKEVILVLAAEAYGRAKAVDVHGETNLKTIPQPQGSAQYPLTIGVFEEADGHGVKNKLKIGGQHMNILSTMSICLREEQCVDIGPATSVLADSIRPGCARLFFPRDSIRSFMTAFEDKSHVFPITSISSMRQISTGFDDPSSFAPWRAGLAVLETDLTMPATVFTLCDLPHNQGYGSSASSTEKVASRFIQALCIAHLESTPPDFTRAFTFFDSVAKTRERGRNPSKEWGKLAASVDALKLLIEERRGSSALDLAMFHDFSSFANLASNRLSDCNTRLKENVKMRLSQIYGDN